MDTIILGLQVIIKPVRNGIGIGTAMSKVEAPVVHHLRDLGADGEEFEVIKFFSHVGM